MCPSSGGAPGKMREGPRALSPSRTSTKQDQPSRKRSWAHLSAPHRPPLSAVRREVLFQTAALPCPLQSLPTPTPAAEEALTTLPVQPCLGRPVSSPALLSSHTEARDCCLLTLTPPDQEAFRGSVQGSHVSSPQAPSPRAGARKWLLDWGAPPRQCPFPGWPALRDGGTQAE